MFGVYFQIERPPFEIRRFHVSNVTAEEFRDTYESIHEPLIIDVSEVTTLPASPGLPFLPVVVPCVCSKLLVEREQGTRRRRRVPFLKREVDPLLELARLEGGRGRGMTIFCSLAFSP